MKRVIEGGIDAIEGKMGEIRWREIGRERKVREARLLVLQ